MPQPRPRPLAKRGSAVDDGDELVEESREVRAAPHDALDRLALVAFSEADREAFQTVFEQLVEVFSERESVQRIVRRGTDFAAFLDELVAVVDG